MRILLTNDDGIQAPGLRVLARWAQSLGQVTVVAPKFQQSATSCSINIHQPFSVEPFSWDLPLPAWSVDSTPADCVRIATAYLEEEFDLVLSGINRGFNVGADIAYSGTCGAAFEAAASGIKSIAFSTWPEDYVAAEQSLPRVWEYIRSRDLLSFAPILNVNIPPEAGDILWTRQAGPYYLDHYEKTEGSLVQARGYSVYDGSFDPKKDLDAVMKGYISISPLSIARTDEAAYQRGLELAF